jgi:predicted nucleotidyltransferase
VADDDFVARLTTLVESAPPDIVSVYLFGSTARGTAHAKSDVDLGMLMTATPPPTLEGRLFGYADDLGRTLGRAVQIVILNDASPDLVHRILRDGKILLDRDRVVRIRFEVHSRNEYFDLLPMLRHYRATVLKNAGASPS